MYLVKPAVSIIPLLLLGSHSAWAQLPPCQPLNTSVEIAPATVPQQAKKVAMLLREGLLKPQLTAILEKHFNIHLVDWQASPHHRWPSEYRVDAWSWAELLSRVLEPYGMQLIIHANRSAVVRYRFPTDSKQQS